MTVPTNAKALSKATPSKLSRNENTSSSGRMKKMAPGIHVNASSKMAEHSRAAVISHCTLSRLRRLNSCQP